MTVFQVASISGHKIVGMLFLYDHTDIGVVKFKLNL